MTERFVGQVGEALGLELSHAVNGLSPPSSRGTPIDTTLVAGGVADVIAACALPKSHLPHEEAARYLALCERAWLHWSRQALIFVIAHRLRKGPVGAFKPCGVRNAKDALEASVKCDLHFKLLDEATRDLTDSEWSWQFEAARHVHASTKQALGIAAKVLDDPCPPSIQKLAPGISSAADALVIAISAGFILSASSETLETLGALAQAG